jgi:hypothetical protein
MVAAKTQGCATFGAPTPAEAARRAAPARAVLLAGLIAGVMLGTAAGPLAAQPAPDIQSIADQAIHRLDLQTEFPREPEPLRVSLPPEILWIVIAVALGVLAYACRDLWPGWRSGGTGAWQSDEALPGTDPTGNPALILEAADELAAAGRFVEAMHVLLLRALAEMRQRMDEQFADSLTSREILRSTRLPEGARASLRDVIVRVELTYFGERPAAQADYLACRSSFNALAQSLYGSVAI